MTTLARASVLQVRDLSFAYPSEPALLSDWSVSIAAGVSLLHGDTGSGKSTVLRLFAGTQQAAAGRLTLAGVDLDTDPVAYRRAVFWCDPASEAFASITARDCTAALCAGDTGFDAAGWQALVDAFALTPHLDKPMYMLSTGSKRKVGLAAALASGRALTLLDEPTGGLDAASVKALMRALASRSGHTDRAIVVASAERLDSIPLAGVIELPPR